MSALVSILFPEPTLQRTPLSVLGWWESRRLTYNAIVGGTGAITLLGLWVASGFEFFLTPFPWIGAAAYGIAANVCYSLGAPVEILLQRWLKRDTYGLGPALFRHGLVYSVGLTLFPLALAGLAVIARIVATLLF